MIRWFGKSILLFALAVVLIAVSAGPSDATKLRGSGKQGGMTGMQGKGLKEGAGTSGQGGSAQPMSGEGDGPSPEVIGAFVPTKADRADMELRGFFATGLEPQYPSGFDCGKITSTFADEYRTDGSRRSKRYFDGLHSGIDIPIPEGTPILAVADGTVVHRTDETVNIGGIGLVLQHAPEGTGLPVWTYTEYKHLREPTSLQIGARVHMGDVVGYAGVSGTTGGHYGEEGLSHLHLGAYESDQADYKAARLFIPVGGKWMDPLALMRAGMPVDSNAVKNLPPSEKKVRIPYKTVEGQTVPEATKIIWPFACKPAGT